MAGPWEDYSPPSAQAPAPEAAGPWSDYAPPEKTAGQSALDWLPTAGAVIGGIGGGLAGTAVAPGPGTVAGEVAGASGGAALGSAAKDMINNWVYGGTKGAGDIAKDAGIEGAISGASQLIGGAILKGAGKVAGKVAEKVIPVTVLEKYKQASDVVMKLWNDADGNIAAAADTVKQGMQSSLDSFRKQEGEKIAAALADNTTLVKGNKITEALEKYKGTLDADLHSEEIKQVDGLITKISSKMDENGDMFAKDANTVKQWLQDKATTAYRMAGETGGGTDVANAAKQGAAVARKVVSEAVPEVAEANQKLASLHFIEDRMNKSLIRTGQSESGLIAAGKGVEGSPRNAQALKLLGDITGQDFLGKAQELAAAKTFGNASMMGALRNTGAGAVAGGAIGGGAGMVSDATGMTEHGAKYGALAGATLGGALTSPYAIKKAIDFAPSVAPYTPAASQSLGQAVMHGTGAASSLKRVGQ